MDKVGKALRKFNQKEKNAIKSIFIKIKKNDFKNLDLKKLKGENNIFRARKGKIRIIYRISKNKRISILTIERRSETTYNKF